MTDFNNVRILGDEDKATVLDTKSSFAGGHFIFDPRIRMLDRDGNELLLIEEGKIQTREFTISGRIIIDDGGLGGVIRVLKGNDEEIETIRLEGSSSTVFLNDDGGKETIRLEGSSSNVVINGDDGNESIRLSGSGGRLQLMDTRNAQLTIQMDGETGNVVFGSTGNDGRLTLLAGTNGQSTISLNGRLGHALFGGHGTDGKITLADRLGRTPISLDGNSGNAKLTGDLILNTISLEGNTGSAILGGNGEDGELTLKTSTDQTTVSLDGNTGGVALGGRGQGGDLRLSNKSGQTTLSMSGDAGDISFLSAANCAVDFDVVDATVVEPGSVMVMEEDGRLRQSSQPYDKRAVGVVSGAKDTQPGIVLDRKSVTLGHKPIALMGKVFCNVDATIVPIEVGDLITTSPTVGHAMKADDHDKAFGAVIGKALSSLPSGKGLIPILITLQ
jgi:hypothetical protein